MADIFHEIDEDLRRERLGKIWSRYGAYIVALVVVIVLGVAAWRGYEWYRAKQAEAAGARFAAALRLAGEGKHEEAEKAFSAIAVDGSGGYRVLARFRAAAELAATDKPAAVAAYDGLANDTALDPLTRDIARLRAGYLLVDTAPLADVEARMKPLDTDTGPFRHSAREIVGLAQYRAGDLAAATKTFETILSDPETPPGLRQRAELMRGLAAGGPAPEIAPAPAAVIAPAPTLDAPTLQLPTPLPDAPAGTPPATPEAGAPAIAAPETTVPDTAAPAPEAAAPAAPASPVPAEPAPAEAAPAAPAEPAPAAPGTPAPATPPAAVPEPAAPAAPGGASPAAPQ
ncbi:tetratricopeptide repeat protein [Ancylobacter lacus]|uniref:tetratricopeptide repeat protein n=1 Tax=Ancylobacter lacus TaxID=2579970 RepID=UPI001BCE0DA0|nr:tetratricopeptide repeat protein [Ancylobacter lacus]MBS7540966.1 tetratricopeptide repeat protein [Ancylobacter lacus]